MSTVLGNRAAPVPLKQVSISRRLLGRKASGQSRGDDPGDISEVGGDRAYCILVDARTG